MKIPVEDRLKIKRLYEIELVPMVEIAEKYAVTRQAVHKVLNRLGVDTSKKGGIELICKQCGIDFVRSRYRVRNSKNQFCSTRCYGDSKIKNREKE